MEWVQKWLTGEGGLLKVRAWLALGSVGTTLFMWATEVAVSSEQLIIVTAIITHYFAGRQGDKAANIASEESRRMDGVLEAWETEEDERALTGSVVNRADIAAPEPSDDPEPDHSGG